METKKNKNKKYLIIKNFFLVFNILLSFAIVLLFIEIIFKNKFLPNTYVNNISIANLTVQQAYDKLKNIYQPNYTIDVLFKNKTYKLKYKDIVIDPKIEDKIVQLFNDQQKISLIDRIKQRLLLKKQNIQIELSVNEDNINKFLDKLEKNIQPKPEDPVIQKVNNSFVVKNGIDGIKIDKQQTISNFQKIINSRIKDKQIVIQTKFYKNQLTKQEIQDIYSLIDKLEHKKINLYINEYKDYDIKIDDLVNFINPKTQDLDITNIEKYLNTLKEEIDTPAQDAVFEFDLDKRQVYKFIPDKPGIKLKIKQTSQAIKEQINLNLENEEKEVKISAILEKVEPTKKLKDTNNIGINERIAFGKSLFYHSSANRIHNIKTASNKLNLALVAPNETFSLNKRLGPVTTETGYKKAYVIKDGTVKLEAGGGVCQVSTTLFRALLNGGFPITKRYPHSFRVRYYELNNDPGFDATVYSGERDLQFINDTGHFILINTKMDEENYQLFVEIYGTYDGRIATITEYKKWGYTPPPPPEYIKDPTKPEGYIKQVDWPVAGIKTSFRYIVKDKDGNVKIDKVFVSNYKAWSAKYIVGGQ